jgi:hypothetical protein
MPTIWKTGPIRNARNMVKVKNWPRVRVCAIIWRAPRYITSAPSMPIMTVAPKLMKEVEVRLFITLSNRRCTPPETTSASAASAW